MTIMKVDREKIRVLMVDIQQAIQNRLNKTGMHAAEIQLALTQVIYKVGAATNALEKEKALREKPTVAA